MGTDIECFAERKTEHGYVLMENISAFNWRSYGLYGFLAGVRNYSSVPLIAEPRGIPDDASQGVINESEDDCEIYCHSWLTIDELLAFNYDATFEDLRYTKQTGPNSFDGSATAEPGVGNVVTLRSFLGEGFFNEIQRLKDAGVARIVFWFSG